MGISWVTICKEKGKKLDEKPFEVNVDDEAIFQKVGLPGTTTRRVEERHAD